MQDVGDIIVAHAVDFAASSVARERTWYLTCARDVPCSFATLASLVTEASSPNGALTSGDGA